MLCMLSSNRFRFAYILNEFEFKTFIPMFIILGGSFA